MTGFDLSASLSNRKMLLNVSKRSVAWAIFFLAYMNPAYLDRFALFGMFTTATKIVAFGWFLLSCIKKTTFCPRILVWIGYAAIPATVTFLNGGDSKSALVYAFTIISLALSFFYIKPKNVRDMISGLAGVMEILVFINLSTIVLVPKGLYMYQTEAGWLSSEVWFFGLKNSHPPFLIVACFASVMDYHFNGGQGRKALLVFTHAISVATVFLLNSGGGMVSFVMYFLLIIVLNKKKTARLNPYKLKFSTVVIIHVGIFVFLSFFAAITNVADYFGIIGEQRVYTLGRRISIWAAVWERIIDAPLFGSGFMKIENLDWLTSLAAGATSSHNSMIDICFRGGFATLVVYCIMLISSGRNTQKSDRISYKLKNYIAVSWFTILLILQSEGAMMCVPLLVIVGITYNIGRACESQSSLLLC